MPPEPSTKTLEQVHIFRNRIEKVARHLRRWPSRGIACYRLYDHDIHEVPIVVDRYEDKLHVAEYAGNHDRTPAEHRAWLDLMVKTAAEVVGVTADDVFLKRRERQSDVSQYEKAGSEGRVFEVREGGLKFLVNLSDYVDTGLFLDHRITRSLVREEAAGKRFLNLFAYTGSFTVYAAAGGAASTTTVDLSNTYLEWAQRNLRLNGFGERGHRFIRDDAMAFLREHRPVPSYDLVVVDPPTISKSKMAGLFDIARHHVEMLERIVRLTAPGGTIYFSTNFRKFKMGAETILGIVPRELSARTVPPDFHDRKIHRSWKLVVPGGAGAPARAALP
jgi:23S rRNA G2069 N7-methylase RlmK/C1962 C5-methylase RlmI